MLDAKLYLDQGAGFRDEDMPYQQDAWRHALAAIDADAKDEHDGLGFAAVDDAARDAYLTRMHDGEVDGRHWNGIDPQKFFKRRVLVDVPPLFYGLPKAWDEMGFGGPASPRGYVRLEGNRRDPWEAVEAKPGDQAQCRTPEPPCRLIRSTCRARHTGVRPTCSASAAGCRCANSATTTKSTS